MNYRKTLSLLLLGLTVNSYAQVDPDLSIDPVVTHFGAVQLGQNSSPITVTVSNDKASGNLVLGTASFNGGDTDQFNIQNNNCNGQTLAPSGTCTLEVRYAPTKLGTRMSMLQVPTDDTTTPVLVSFFSNDEDNEVQAERRLPPVLYSLTMPETMAANSTHNISWTMLGYHSSYSTVVAFFDCTGKAAGTCGLNFGENFLFASIATPASTTNGTETFQGETSKQFTYNYTFDPTNGGAKTWPSGNTDIVVRFYRKNPMDQAAGESSLSLLVPGNLTQRYYDNEGRRITKTISN